MSLFRHLLSFAALLTFLLSRMGMRPFDQNWQVFRFLVKASVTPAINAGVDHNLTIQIGKLGITRQMVDSLAHVLV